MRLLFIEDSTELVTLLTTILGTDYVIDTALNGVKGIAKATTKSYDAIILDLGLPDMPGEHVCTAIRKAEVATPILVLTGDVTSDTKVTMFACGADDYVTKPFNNSELRARLKALQRRSTTDMDTIASTVLSSADLTLDTSKRQVMRAGKRIILRRKEFDILEYLLINKGKVVTRGMLINYVWGGNVASWHNTVDVHIKNLRDKVDRPYEVKLIRTEYGLGYMLRDLP